MERRVALGGKRKQGFRESCYDAERSKRAYGGVDRDKG